MRWIATVIGFSCLIVPFAAGAQATQGAPVEIGQRYVLQSKNMDSARDFAVFVPPACTAETRCPALYVLDGAADTGFPFFAGLVNAGPLLRIFKPIVVIGIASVDRNNELTFPTTDGEALKKFPTAGGSARFRRFVVDEVKPWATANLPISDESILLGHSFGGLFVVETALKAPADFTHYIATSPSLWWDNKSLLAAAPAGIAKLGGHSLYLTLGNEVDPEKESVQNLVALLDKSAPADLRWTWQPRPDQNHGSIIVATASDALRWVLSGQQAKPADAGIKAASPGTTPHTAPAGTAGSARSPRSAHP